MYVSLGRERVGDDGFSRQASYGVAHASAAQFADHADQHEFHASGHQSRYDMQDVSACFILHTGLPDGPYINVWGVFHRWPQPAIFGDAHLVYLWPEQAQASSIVQCFPGRAADIPAGSGATTRPLRRVG